MCRTMAEINYLLKTSNPQPLMLTALEKGQELAHLSPSIINFAGYFAQQKLKEKFAKR